MNDCFFYFLGISVEATVYTFGFSADHNPDLLKAISDAGNGMYYYIENEDNIAESFGHCLGGLLNTAAQGMLLEIETEDGVVLKKVNTEKPVTMSDDGRKIKVPLGDIHSEEERDLVVEVALSRLPAPPKTSMQTIFNATLNYLNAFTRQPEAKVSSLRVNRSVAVKNLIKESSNAIVCRQRNRVKLIDTMKQAAEKASSNDLSGALRLLNDAILYIGASASANHELCQAMVEDLEKCVANCSDQKTWESKGRHLLMNLMQMHSAQRSSHMSSKAYQSKAKVDMASKAKDYVE